MATEMSTDDTPQKHNLKLDCKCSRSVVTLLQTIENYVLKVSDSQDGNQSVGKDIFKVILKIKNDSP